MAATCDKTYDKTLFDKGLYAVRPSDIQSERPENQDGRAGVRTAKEIFEKSDIFVADLPKYVMVLLVTHARKRQI